MDDSRARRAIRAAARRYRRQRGEYVPVEDVPWVMIDAELRKEFGSDDAESSAGPTIADVQRLIADMQRRRGVGASDYWGSKG